MTLVLNLGLWLKREPMTLVLKGTDEAMTLVLKGTHDSSFSREPMSLVLKGTYDSGSQGNR